MKETKRAIRRHHIKRLKRNRIIWWGRKLDAKEISQVVDTPTPCSCSMCGNPRKWFGESTIQERKAEIKLLTWLFDNN